MRSALLEQWHAISPWLGQLPDDAWPTASVVDGWSVADLIAHLSLVWDSVSAALAAPSRDRPLTVADYLAGYVEGAAAIDARTRRIGAGTPADIGASVQAHATAAVEVLRALADDADPVVAARRGPIRLSDFLLTRCVELVVHADDLARSVPALGPPPLHKGALQLVVRSLASVLAERAPGRSVEVRVPPFAAVQCVAGPRHTRGTPPAVVETEPLTFVRLACGRLAWADAVAGGAVRSSGLRTDLSGFLPLLA